MSDPSKATTARSGDGYFLYHSIGTYPGKQSELAASLQQFAADWCAHDDGQWARALTMRQSFIDLWRSLIQAPPGTLTTAENVTTALYSLIGALPAQHLKGRRVLVAADCFPSLHFLLSGLAARDGHEGFTLETVHPRAGEYWVRDEDMVARWGPDVGLALLTWVTSTASHRCNLQRLVAHGRQMGSLVGVDITQAAGLLPFNVNAPAVDFTLASSLKWLCGASGAAILHVAEPLLGQCAPLLRGWFSQENIFSWDLDRFSYAPDIRRFDHGTPSVLACAGSLPALQWNLRQDRSAMLAHNRLLGAAVIDGARMIGLPLISPFDPDQRGGSVMLQVPDDVEPGRLLQSMREKDIWADCRGKTLRLSPGAVTTLAGVERLLVVLESELQTARPRGSQVRTRPAKPE